jgi:hypothetical protein
MHLSLLPYSLVTFVCMAATRPPRKPKKLYPVNIRMDEPTLNALRQIADEEDRTVSNLLTRIVKEWLAARDVKGGATS